MQAALRRAWPRFSFLGVALNEAKRRGTTLPAGVASAAGRDAVATLLQVLRARLHLREARRLGAPPEPRAPGSKHSPAPIQAMPQHLQPAAGCAADPYGGDISPWDGTADAQKQAVFEERTVNGWVI